MRTERGRLSLPVRLSVRPASRLTSNLLPLSVNALASQHVWPVQSCVVRVWCCARPCRERDRPCVCGGPGARAVAGQVRRMRRCLVRPHTRSHVCCCNTSRSRLTAARGACRKLAAQKGMLNRGEAPAAQLFKISEQAEIRYTNNGLLYEVPADEVASNPSSAGSQPLGSGSARLASRCALARPCCPCSHD